MIAVAGSALLGAALFVTQVFLFDQDPPFLNIGVATWISASLPIVYGVVLRLAFRQEKWRKVLLSPFDVGTFFPRSFHPFAPPSYTERAVPELTRRIWRLHDNQGRVVLTAHSQGSMVAAAALARQSARHEEKTVGLVTLGSPLAKLYRWAFPALVSDGLLQNFAGGRGGIGCGPVAQRLLRDRLHRRTGRHGWLARVQRHGRPPGRPADGQIRVRPAVAPDPEPYRLLG